MLESQSSIAHAAEVAMVRQPNQSVGLSTIHNFQHAQYVGTATKHNWQLNILVLPTIRGNFDTHYVIHSMLGQKVDQSSSVSTERTERTYSYGRTKLCAGICLFRGLFMLLFGCC